MTQVALVLYIVAKIGNYFSTLGLGYTGQYDPGWCHACCEPILQMDTFAEQSSEPVVLLQLCS